MSEDRRRNCTPDLQVLHYRDSEEGFDEPPVAAVEVLHELG